VDDAWLDALAASPWLIPALFARIAVNLAAGAGHVPLRRYLPLSAFAGVAWACYNVAIGAIVGSAIRDAPLLAIAISIPIAMMLGLAVDRVVARLDALRPAARSSDPVDDA
jgi:membrane-associated protein